MLKRIFPFMVWFKDYNLPKLKIDVLAGITVALVLIPQSMAYAQLAGLPAYYGLYAAFLPPMIASLFGSSRQLATGPVAVVSLMTATSLEPLATAGSDAFIVYAIILAFTVGVFQLALGIFRLGLVVNFLSHPVVNGFTNAAAIVIATSQLSKLFGVYVDNSPHHYQTIISVIKEALNYTHWPTLALGVFAIAIMYGIKRFNPRIPYVLIAVVITTLFSYFSGYEQNRSLPMTTIANPEIRENLIAYNDQLKRIKELSDLRMEAFTQLEAAESHAHGQGMDSIKARFEVDKINFEIDGIKNTSAALRAELRSLKLYSTENVGSSSMLYLKEEIPPGFNADSRIWHFKVGTKPLNPEGLMLYGGGDVVGAIPQGLPSLSVPELNLSVFLKLFPYAMVISLLGFVEAIAIAKAMAAKTGQRLDPDQELIGQGLANILGAIGKSYPVSGSFSRSAVNLQAGAVTGMSSVFTSFGVIITLLFFTPLLYHLPQAVLAAVIMMAVIGLLNVSGFIHAWRAQWYDGAISILTFLATLALAPHVEKGIYIGVVASLGVFLYKVMRPKVSSLSRHADEGLKAFDAHGLLKCQYIDLIRFDGPLFFANASYLEDEINNRLMSQKDLNHIIIAANGINDIDASGEETLALIINRLRSAGYGISFSGVNDSVMKVFKKTHLLENIGQQNIYTTMEKAILSVHTSAHLNSTEEQCPLLTVCEAAAKA
ncbi:MAG: SulP family inorganic anion transporter [Proteobacteria bacterium]|nr:SulP family inorganic anion transporter [Pseudomonadota bacterium]MBU4469458.1 SulP family inorganic anion transporter [Pseudomonadota bacterium]MCG2752359.1 SulP family inorganic anion transporter [Desulfobacteraceae bacterium]